MQGKKRKTMQLNRIILLAVMTGYCGLLCLLLILDFFMLHSFRTEEIRTEQESLLAYAAGMEEISAAVQSILYNIDQNNRDFHALQQSQDTVELFANAYDLRENLRYYMDMNEGIGGFFLHWDGLDENLYVYDEKQISFSHAWEISSRIDELSKSASGKSGWTAFKIEDTVYLVFGYQRGIASLYGVCSLGDISRALQERKQSSGESVLIVGDIVYLGEETEKELNLRTETAGRTEDFEIEKENCRIHGTYLKRFNLWLLTVYRLGLLDRLNIPTLLLFLLTGLSMVAVYMLYRFLYREILSPIRQLTRNMECIRNGDRKGTRKLLTCFRELEETDETLRGMVEALEQQKLMTYEAVIEQQKAQLQYQQLQLKPHFYLNSLKTLNVLAMDGHTEEIQDLIMDLSEHMRYLLQTEREMVSVSSELAFTENFVQMQKYISGRKVLLAIDCEPEAGDWEVPTLAIQTFVENSVKYAALGNWRTALEIQVAVCVLHTEDGRYLDITVSDNGAGYPQEVLDKINADTVQGSSCIGIRNLKRRCRLLYGEEAQFNFSNFGGANSELVLPEHFDAQVYGGSK